MKRRVFLTIVTSFVFAGCTSFNDDREEVIVDTISVNNRNGETREIEVAVIEDEETVFEETYSINSGSAIVEDNLIDGPGHYLIRVSTTGSDMELNVWEYTNEDDQCAIIRFEINSSGEFNPPSIHSYQEC